MKQFTSQQLWDKFTKLNKVEQYEIMYRALEIMQIDNEKTRQSCIFKSMGYLDKEGYELNYIKI